MKLTVVIVSYNVKYYLAQCLCALKRALRDMDAEVVVVDNDSKDGSVEYLQQVHPWVRYVQAGSNLGFSKANNVAIRQSRSEYVLLLNPDTVVGEDVLREAVAFMDAHPRSGGVGVRMLNCDGTDALESRRGVPTPVVAFWKMTGFSRRFPASRFFGRYYMGWLAWDRSAPIEIMSGAFCMMRRQTLDEVGLLDEDFFMYGEDIDLSYRILKGGWENWYLPLRILHYKGESTQKTSYRYVTVFYNAMLIFVRKHFRHFSCLMSPPLQLAIYLKASCSIVGVQLRKWLHGARAAHCACKDIPVFVFHVAEGQHAACARLVAKHHLDARYLSEGQRPEDVFTPEPQQTVYHVYDVSQCRFDDLFAHFAARHGRNDFMAFWHPDRQMLVTNHDVYRL